jgi:tetratricopeptide (TPR) repeat protein
LELVPQSMLSPRARGICLKLHQDAALAADTPAAAGYAKIAAAAAGDASAFWFFDLGHAAWISLLGQLRTGDLLPADAEEKRQLAHVEQLWMRQGPAAAAAELDRLLGQNPLSHPAYSLYRTPLALLHDGDPRMAMACADRGIARLNYRAVGLMGATIPLTYAMCHAMLGDLRSAEKTLNEDLGEARPAGWTGYRTAEARYQRSRYVWELGLYEESAALIGKVIAADPDYMLRMHSDPVFASRVTASGGPLQALIQSGIEQARVDLDRWQRNRIAGDREAPAVRRIVDVIDALGIEPYSLLCVGRLIPSADAWRSRQMALGATFNTDLKRLREFAAVLPSAMPLRLASSGRRRFDGVEDSDMAVLESLVDRGRVAEAADMVERVIDDLPYSTKLASFAYLVRLSEALATSGNVLSAGARPEDESRYDVIVELGKRCLGLVEPIRALPETFTQGLAQQLVPVWDEIAAIETSWIRSEDRAFGLLRIVPPAQPPVLVQGTFRAPQVLVTDSAGQPAAGVPVLWRVASGPAVPKTPADCLDGEWASSLATGIVYLSLEVRGSGASGTIEVRILGNYSPVTIPYSVS